VLVTCEPTPALVRAAEKAGLRRIWRLDDVREGARSDDADDNLATTLDAQSEVASITYTEAASDVPMGVMVTHGNLVANVQQTQAVDSLDSTDVLLGVMPFCQLYGMVAVNLALHASATVVTFPHFSLAWLLQAIERYRVTVAYLVPPVIRTLAKHSEVDKFDLSALKKITAFTAPLPDSVARACARPQCNVRQAYGLTEAVALTHFTPRVSPKVASVGLPHRCLERCRWRSCCRLSIARQRRPHRGH
jgi:acyl-CoA synthetase (AMP-forming)/AMP-acid ligase II